jgi:tRNA-modifying protein YgfZ
MHGECTSVPLAALGALRVRGPDALTFLQGQLSNDVARLAPQRSLLAGYHNAQGRAIALLRLVQLARDDVLAIVPRELAGTVVRRLTKFILRAKVELADESAQWLIGGIAAAAAPAAATAVTALTDALPAAADGAARVDGAIAVRVPGPAARWLLIGPAGHPPALSGCRPAAPEHWQRLAIAAGEPEVYALTSEAFVAQMLNLDVLGAIAFDKGCYTGQEVIARAHYRGRVKRRMQRFLTAQPAQLQPGDAGVLADGRSFRVVRAVAHPDGRCEFLAVTAVAPAAGADPAAAAGAALDTAATPLSAQPLELPYPLPD